MFRIARRVAQPQRPSKRFTSGASLLEVLISVLLAAIGLLALAGANVASIRYSKLSQYRGTATVLALDLGERMRANKAGIMSYGYTAATFAAQTAAAINTDQTCEAYVGSTPCTTAQLAAYDLNTWRRVVRSQLPSGSVYVDIMDLAGNSCAVLANCIAADVWMAWRDPAVADPDDNSTDSRNAAGECPNGLSAGTDKSIRCSFFRINL